MQEIQAEQKKYGSGRGEFFEFEEKGVYKMRILHQPKVVATHFFGKGNPAVVCVGIDEGCPHHKGDDKKPSIKLATYIIDRNDQEAAKKAGLAIPAAVKMAELPLSLSYGLNDLQEDSDFAFEDFPMPYDIKVTYDPDNADPKAKYRLTPSPTKADISQEEKDALAAKMAKQTPEQYVENKKKRQKEKSGTADVTPTNDYPAEDINPDDIPF